MDNSIATSSAGKRSAKGKRQPKEKGLLELLDALEKRKAQIAKASGNSEIDFDQLKIAAKKAAKEIAAQMNLPVTMLKVTVDILVKSVEAVAE